MKLKEAIMSRVAQEPIDPSRLSKKKHNQEKPPKFNLEETRVMNKKNGYIKGYSANTFHGLVRNYNEDRVSIILNITKPQALEQWPKCSYFAVFDGHGGSLCSDFLRDNMHKFIIEDKNFPFKPIEALKNGFSKAENEFKKLAESTDPVNRSGSCAIVVIIIDKNCYVANVGDSRAIMSANHGQKILPLSNDHKPNAPSQKNRIILNGGNVYQSLITLKNGTVLPGPFRINPGRLSVSRAIGDITAKDEKYEGMSGVLISDPQIVSFQLVPEHDFILIGCDGIFDKLQNEDVVQAIWKVSVNASDNTEFLGTAVEAVLEESMNKKSLDNITAVLILIDKQASKLNPTEPKKSLSTIMMQKDEISNSLVPLKTRKDCGKTDESKNLSRRKYESQSKENTNTANTQDQKQEAEGELMKLKKKSSAQISTKKLELLKKTNQLLTRKKIHQYIRY